MILVDRPARRRRPADLIPARALGLTAALLSAACTGPETQPYFDLVEHFPTAVIEGANAAESQLDTAVADSQTGQLFLPAGSSVSYAFFTEPGSSFRVKQLAIRGRSTRISLTLESDGAESRVVSPSHSSRQWSEDLGLPGDTAARITLQVEASETTPGAGVLLTKPVISGLATESAGEILAPELRAAETRVAENGDKRPNIIIYLIDTLRRDRIGSYGYGRPVSPEIDAFAAESTLFARSHGQSSWTKPTVASLFTGVWPPRHGATGWKHRLDDSFETLPERLRRAGWSTAGFVTNINASKKFGLAQGLDTLWYQRKVDAVTVNDEVFAWLDGIDRSSPFFLYVHTMDPHAGYNPREPFRSTFAPTADEMPPWKPRWRWPVENAPFFSDLYDAEVAQNDAAFGALIDRLRELGLYDDSLVIFLSDHGEEFREHGGWRHNRRLFAETLDVPIVVKFPNQKEARRSDLPVSHVDILPTVLDVAGLPPFADGDGQSLTKPSARPVFSHLRVGRYPLQYGVIRGHWKLVRIHKNGRRRQLFDLAGDPGEAHDLAAELPVRAAAMEALIDRQLTIAPVTEVGQESEISDETERELRALGYLQ